MRDKSDIRIELYNRLNTPAWQSLRNSLVGRELIAFGTDLLYMQEAMNAAVIKSFDFSTADERALISLSHYYDLGLCFSPVSWIRVRIPTGTKNMVFPPYSIRCTLGNVMFTNIRNYTGNQIITLYQGTVRSMLYMPAYGNISFVNSENYEVSSWNTTDLTIGSKVVHSHDLGVAIPDSVMVFVANLTQSMIAGPSRLVNKYNPLRYGSDVLAFKEYTLLDGSLAVLEGDGEWGQVFDGYDLFQIVWLEPSNEVFDISGIRFTGNGIPQEVVVTASAQGLDGVEFARSQFINSVYSVLPVVSKFQIQSFVNSYDYILSSEVESVGEMVNVYVKPYDVNDDTRYADIESDLDLRGPLGSNFNVVSGAPLVIKFLISGGDLSEAQKLSIVDLIKRTYPYQNMEFSWLPDAASTSALIQSNLGISTRVTFHVTISTEGLDSVDSNFLPLRGTVKLYSGGLLVGSDYNGQLYAATSEVSGAAPSKFFGAYPTSWAEGSTPGIGTTIPLVYNGSVLFSPLGLAGFLSDGTYMGSSCGVGYVLGNKFDSSTDLSVIVMENSSISSSSVVSTDPVKAYCFRHTDTTEGMVFYAMIPYGHYFIILSEVASGLTGITTLKFFDKNALVPDDIDTGFVDFTQMNPVWAATFNEVLGVSVPSIGIAPFLQGEDAYVFYGTRCLVLQNVAALQVSARVLSVEFESTELMALVSSYSVHFGTSEGHLAAVFHSGNDIRVVQIGAVLRRSGTVFLSSLKSYKFTTSGVTSEVSTNGVWAMFKDMNGDRLNIVNVETGEVNRPGIYRSESVGSVTYETGVFNVDQDFDIQFDSYNVERPVGSFYMLDESEPCLWS